MTNDDKPMTNTGNQQVSRRLLQVHSLGLLWLGRLGRRSPTRRGLQWTIHDANHTSHTSHSYRKGVKDIAHVIPLLPVVAVARDVHRHLLEGARHCGAAYGVMVYGLRLAHPTHGSAGGCAQVHQLLQRFRLAQPAAETGSITRSAKP
jgi:hypothetical protein